MREKMGKIEQRFIPGQEEGLAPPLEHKWYALN